MAIKETREHLKRLSNAVKDMVKNGEFTTVNEAIIKTAYQNAEHQVFKKFREWKAEGKRIKKGAKAFPVWAKPKDMKKIEHPTLEEDFSFFPVCYLFSNSQVE
jgi:poly-D-alanine transfer protein DltD